MYDHRFIMIDDTVDGSPKTAKLVGTVGFVHQHSSKLGCIGQRCSFFPETSSAHCRDKVLKAWQRVAKSVQAAHQASVQPRCASVIALVSQYGY